MSKKTTYVNCRITSEEKMYLFAKAVEQKTTLSGILRDIINIKKSKP